MLTYDESNEFIKLLTTTQLQYLASNTFSLKRLFESEHLQKAAKEAYIIFSAQTVN